MPIPSFPRETPDTVAHFNPPMQDLLCFPVSTLHTPLSALLPEAAPHRSAPGGPIGPGPLGGPVVEDGGKPQLVCVSFGDLLAKSAQKL